MGRVPIITSLSLKSIAVKTLTTFILKSEISYFIFYFPVALILLLFLFYFLSVKKRKKNVRVITFSPFFFKLNISILLFWPTGQSHLDFFPLSQGPGLFFFRYSRIGLGPNIDGQTW